MPSCTNWKHLRKNLISILHETGPRSTLPLGSKKPVLSSLYPVMQGRCPPVHVSTPPPIHSCTHILSLSSGRAPQALTLQPLLHPAGGTRGRESQESSLFSFPSCNQVILMSPLTRGVTSPDCILLCLLPTRMELA